MKPRNNTNGKELASTDECMPPICKIATRCSGYFKPIWSIKTVKKINNKTHQESAPFNYLLRKMIYTYNKKNANKLLKKLIVNCPPNVKHFACMINFTLKPISRVWIKQLRKQSSTSEVISSHKQKWIALQRIHSLGTHSREPYQISTFYSKETLWKYKRKLICWNCQAWG